MIYLILTLTTLGLNVAGCAMFLQIREAGDFEKSSCHASAGRKSGMDRSESDDVRCGLHEGLAGVQEGQLVADSF